MIQNYSPERTAKSTPGRVAPRLTRPWCRDRLELAVLEGEEVAGGRGYRSHQARGLREKLFGVEPRENELLLGVLGVPAPGEKIGRASCRERGWISVGARVRYNEMGY